VHLFQCYEYRTEKPRSQRIGYIYKHETSGKCWKSELIRGDDDSVICIGWNDF